MIATIRSAVTIALSMVGLAMAIPASAQTLVEATGGTVTQTGFYGQSFTLGATSQNIAFQFLNTGGTNTGSETGLFYLFTSPYAGTPNGLAAATGTAGYVGTATGSSVGFRFAPSLSLTGGVRYYGYTDTANTVSGATDTLGGSSFALSGGAAAAYNNQSTADLNFRVLNATGLAPEPATWLLLLLGFGATGIAMRRRARPPVLA